MKGVPFDLSIEAIRKGYPFLQNKGKGLDLGRSLPVLKLFKAPSGQKAIQGLGNLPGFVAIRSSYFANVVAREKI